MKRTIALLAAAVIAVTPTTAFSVPPTTNATGQPGVECDEPGGTPPGNSAEEHGNPAVNGTPFTEDSSVSGSHYAGEQPQNSKNPKSVSQYDIACFRGPDRPSGG